MSSNIIVPQSIKFINTIGAQLPKKLQGMFRFGVKSFCLQPLVSCNSNARTSHTGSPRAALQMMYRLLRHQDLQLSVWQAIANIQPLTNSNLVNVDYSNLGPLAILGFAAQTHQGRARPVLMESLASNTQGFKQSHPKYHKVKQHYQLWKKALQVDQYSFVTLSLDKLQRLYNTQPRLVFDRGFANTSIVSFLVEHGWTFYIRARGGFNVELNGHIHQVNQLKPGDYRVIWRGYRLRLVVGVRRRNCTEPWYILTNDHNLLSSKVLKVYYYRFEIEETFRDLKSLLLLKGSRIRTWQSLQTVLCFMSLAIIVALLTVSRKLLKLYYSSHTKKRLSIVRYWQEDLHSATRRLSFDYWGLGDV